MFSYFKMKRPRKVRHLSSKHIFKAVSAYYGMSVKDLLDDTSSKSIKYARPALFFLLKKHSPYSIEKIGEIHNCDYLTAFEAFYSGVSAEDKPQFEYEVRTIETFL